MKFDIIVHPFIPSALLQKHLKTYPREYAASGREAMPWLIETVGWKIMAEDSAEMGYVWLPPEKGTNEEKYFNIAVYDEYSNKKVATGALSFLESQIKSLGIKKLKAIVLSNRGKGYIVRKWLYKNDFVITGKSLAYKNIKDEEYINKMPTPIMFEKIYT